ncbi:MAG: hypothetical protein ACRCYR_03765 [Phycicoccus sp.]
MTTRTRKPAKPADPKPAEDTTPRDEAKTDAPPSENAKEDTPVDDLPDDPRNDYAGAATDADPDTSADPSVTNSANPEMVAPTMGQAATPPAAGPLDAPTEDKPDGDVDVPRSGYMQAGEVGVVAASNRVDQTLVEDGPDADPLDPDSLFEKVAGLDSVYVCTKRIMQVVNPGEGWSDTTLLVMPKGQQVSKDQADHLCEIIRSQQS